MLSIDKGWNADIQNVIQELTQILGFSQQESDIPYHLVILHYLRLTSLGPYCCLGIVNTTVVQIDSDMKENQSHLDRSHVAQIQIRPSDLGPSFPFSL